MSLSIIVSPLAWCSEIPEALTFIEVRENKDGELQRASTMSIREAY